MCESTNSIARSVQISTENPGGLCFPPFSSMKFTLFGGHPPPRFPVNSFRPFAQGRDSSALPRCHFPTSPVAYPLRSRIAGQVGVSGVTPRLSAWSSVSQSVKPICVPSRLVMYVARLGEHTGVGTKEFSNSAPEAASRSRLGVGISFPP